MRSALLIAFTSIATLAPEYVHASGLLAARFGGELGHPTTDDPTAAYFNPAGLSLRKGTRVYANGLVAYRYATYDRPVLAIDGISDAGQAGTPGSAISANAGRATLFNVVAAPFVAIVSDLGVRNLALALAFYVPFGGGARWDKNPEYRDSAHVGAVDGVQRWSTISGSFRSYYLTAAGSYTIERIHLSVGAAVNLVVNEIEAVRARNVDGTDDLVTSRGELKEGRSYLTAQGVTASLALGVIWRPTPRWWVGASYQSQPGFGETTMEGTAQTKLGNAPIGKQQVEIRQSLPDVVRLGARFRPTNRIELRLFGEYVRWQVFDKQCVLERSVSNRSCRLLADGSPDTANGGAGIVLALDRKWQDAFGLRAGVSYWVRPTIELFAGAGYDGNAVPDSTLDASTMDMHKMTLSIGGRIEVVRRKLAIAATYTQGIYFDRTVPVRPRDAEGRAVSLLSPSKSPDNAGNYRQSIGALSVSVEYLF